MISLPLSTGIKCLFVFVLPLFSSCDDGLTYDENGQVVTGQQFIDTTEPFIETTRQRLLSDSLSNPDTFVYKAPEKLPVPAGLDTALINTKSTTPDELLAFAESQFGVRYKYGSINPKVGFDCSGFITYVFSHFGIKVPRSSVDFTHVGKAIPVAEAKKGDLILFTGTNPKIRVVGHMGIVHTVENGEIKFHL